MTVAILSILLLVVCFVALGLWVWAGSVHSDYLEAKWEADYYWDKWCEAMTLNQTLIEGKQ